MNGTQNRKNRNFEKPVPGCLGRVVNLFDLNTGVGGNRLLMDKPHRDGSPLSRSRSDVSRMIPFVDQMEDKVMVSEFRRSSSNRRSNGTPIKMLIAQEMSIEVESKHNPPNLVAKLMGLDALPQHHPNSASRRGHSRGSSRSHSGISMDFLQREHVFSDTLKQHEMHQYAEQKEYKDVYEIWQQSGKSDYVRDISPKGRYNDTNNEKKMDLVRQKFMEAKRLSTDDKLRQSKQFQDALEVLSSNKDLFLKFLQEPNSMFSQHLYNLQAIRPPPDTKRITVLRPSKMAESNNVTGSVKRNEKQIKETAQEGHLGGLEKNSPGFSPHPECCKLDDNPTQPTRIVVLKPSPGKPEDIKVVNSPPSLSLRTSNGEEFYASLQDSALESREVAKEITQQMCANLSGHRRDETLLSSVFSNGYIGDESSFNKSEIEYAAGNLSDSEVMSPTSRHSWDYIHRFGSPYSTSSFSRASYSPDSSVCREAKKRLSERWAMMASNGTHQEQRHVRRSSSTLGEMLALSDAKKSVMPDDDNRIKEQESRGSTSCSTNDRKKDEMIENSPKNLLRSKSVPVSSTSSSTNLNLETSGSEKGKMTDGMKDELKERNVKSTFKGRVSNLFFSRNRKSSKKKSQLSKDELQSAGLPVNSQGKFGNDDLHCVTDIDVEKELSTGLRRSSRNVSCQDPLSVGLNHGTNLPEGGFSVTQSAGAGNLNENQEQPSPISVLEPHFEEDDGRARQLCGNFKLDQQGIELPANSIKSNLIDKSPPIGSIARTLSWDDSAMETATLCPLKPFLSPMKAEEENKECLFLVQTLLSEAGLDKEVQSDSFLARWHSPDSPLDPLLRDNYANLDDKDLLHEAKRRQRRSSRKLVFDCVNAALVEIAGCGPCSGAHSRIEDCSSTSVIVDRVWVRMKEWISGEVWCDGGDNSSLVVERVVRKEVVGGGWVEHLRLEMDSIRKEIEGKLLEDLVEEAVTELTGRP